MFRKSITLIGLLQAAAIVTVLFSVVTSFDFVHRNIELYSHFRPQYFAASLALLVIFTALQNPLYAALLLFTTAYNATHVLPWYFGGTRVESDSTVKLLHANVFSGNDEYEKLFKLIDVERPDVIFLQEISKAWQDATIRLHEDYPYRYVEAREGNFGIAMFSRVAPDSVMHVDSPPLDNPTIVATMTVNGESLTLINTHPTVPVSQSQYEARNEQLRSIAALANQAPGAVVLTGDLNASVWSSNYRKLEASTGLRNTRRGFGILPTWPTFMPFAMIPIDHALVSDGIGVVETRTGAHIGSDHLPLIVELAVGR
ncbi:MAG: endonuclease/exonuclease/phosphatase family protein [Gammaproteobacteria bacterium]|nr:endonuclease/exonuclease/phosphatase family protein [Gammaproteobacteria bacterium]MDH3481641.1 endonuclease/exonuclease/phosphatase family protein [Gammaproteobacteria bacterium]